jgi:hypothetical protein
MKKPWTTEGRKKYFWLSQSWTSRTVQNLWTACHHLFAVWQKLLIFKH